MKKLSQEEFIKKANKIHNHFYDYSLTKYINQNIKIDIKCPYHGVFTQRADHHLAGHKCKKCSFQTKAWQNKKKKEKVSFIKRALKKWNNKYNYSLVNYKSAKIKVEIICPEHGEFKQTPDSHLKCECMKCSIKKNADRNRKTPEQFVRDANKIHNNIYDYKLIEYKNNKTKMKIICSQHGIFEQNATNHLQGKGCPVCKNNQKKKK